MKNVYIFKMIMKKAIQVKLTEIEGFHKNALYIYQMRRENGNEHFSLNNQG